MDKSIRPQDDFHNFVNGRWLATTEIPAQHSSYGAFVTLRESAEQYQQKIIKEAASTDAAQGSEQQKIGDYYASYMDEAAIEAAGLSPLAEDLAAIDAIASSADLQAVLQRFIRNSSGSPLEMGIGQDAKNSERYTAYIVQSGLGLPNRDYYLDGDNERFQKVLAAYPGYLATLLKLADIADAEQKAAGIVALETKLAQLHWSAVDNRDSEKTYNPMTAAELTAQTDSIDWPLFFQALEIDSLDQVIVMQPDYLTGLGELIDSESLQSWKDYLSARLLSGSAYYLPKAYSDARFDFYGKVLGGREQQRDRWRRAVDATNAALGEAIGKLYVDRHFPPAAKVRMEQLVDNLLAEFAIGIEQLDWMSTDSKKAAQEKLSKFNVKIGYPDKWQDYSALAVKRDDLLGNVQRATAFDYQYMIDKLGQPIDRDEWHMTPQTVNAYYSRSMNEIVFPAAILQPPFFNMAADDAVNYGAIGMVIGHEISHGFDDQGSKFDGDGNMRNWWNDKDRELFEQRTERLVSQYDAYSPLEGMNVQGALTLGENIGDLSGATVALNAYQRSLKGQPAAVIDGYTGNQRFFLGMAQAWRNKYRDETLARVLVSDPHSPARYRVNGVVVNMPAFYKAFDVQPDDKHYLPEEQRVKLW